jgi:hypothetical protein
MIVAREDEKDYKLKQKNNYNQTICKLQRNCTERIAMNFGSIPETNETFSIFS